MFEAALQKAIFDELSGVLSAPVYDDVPQADNSGDDSAFPYHTIGETTAIPLDTDDSTGVEATVTIHSWSRYRGRKEVKGLQDEVYSALHQKALSVAGYSLAECLFEFSESMLDPDGLTRHGVSRFRVFLST